MEYLAMAGGFYTCKLLYDYFYSTPELVPIAERKKELCKEVQNYNREKLKPSNNDKKNKNKLSVNNELQEILTKKFKNANCEELSD